MAIPSGVLKPVRIGGGFEKESVLTYINELHRNIWKKEELLGIPHTLKAFADIPVGVLKPTRIGNGFEKESVLTYIDQLQQQSNALDNQLSGRN